MNVFDIKNSIIKPFDKVQPNAGYYVPNNGWMVENYISSNLSCGTSELRNLRTLLDASNNQVNQAANAIGSALHMVDSGVNAAFTLAENAARVMDGIAKVSDKIDQLHIGDKLSQIDFSMPDLNINLSLPDARDFARLVDNVKSGISNMLDNALDAMSKFSLDGILDPMYKLGDGEFEIPEMDDPISSLADLMKCQSGDVLGLLSVGLSNLGADNEGFGMTNPLSGALGVIGAAQGAVSGAQNMISTATSSVGQMLNGASSSLNSSINGVINGIDPRIGGFAQKFGVPSMINTALGDTMQSMFGQKTYSACRTAQSLNKFGNYNPFLTSVLGTTGLSKANAAIRNYGGSNGYDSSGRKVAFDDSCKCCVKKEKYARIDGNVNMNSRAYDLSPTYLNSLSKNGSAPYYRQNRNVPTDVWGQTINQYGFQDDNILTQSLGTTLESYRIARKLNGNMDELGVDFGKFSDFAPEATQDLKYIRGLNEDSASYGMYQLENLEDSAYDLLG